MKGKDEAKGDGGGKGHSVMTHSVLTLRPKARARARDGVRGASRGAVAGGSSTTGTSSSAAAAAAAFRTNDLLVLQLRLQ